MDPRADAIRAGYAPVAPAYADRLGDELRGKPLERAMLDAFAEETEGWRVVELGCGPGQVARYLRERGAEIEGLDLCPEMIDEARRHPGNEGIAFEVGDLFALPYEDAAVGGVVAFYAIVHVPTEELDAPVQEIARVLAPGGLALVAFHVGEGEHHVDELFDVATSLDFQLHPVDAVKTALREAGLEIRATLVREPYEGAEYAIRRACVLARRPA